MPQLDEPTGLIWRIADRAMGAMARNSFASRHGRVPAPAVQRRLLVRVQRSDEVADGVRCLELRPLDGQALPSWQAGAHIDVFLRGDIRDGHDDHGNLDGNDNGGGIELQRQYSLCGDPADRTNLRIAVRAIAGGRGSAAMHALRAGDRLEIGHPRNAFPFLLAPRYSFIAGGIGITPILSMIRTAHARGAGWSLHLLGRSEASLPFLDELRALDAARSSEQDGELRIRTDDAAGHPDASELLQTVLPGAPLYCCGPPPLIARLREAAPAHGVTSLHSERFSPAPVTGGAAFEIVLARTGESVAVGPEETALTALRRRRPDLAYSCQQGFCGTCRVGLIGGDVEHRDHALTPIERNNTVMPCVSRGMGRIVVDL